MLASQVPKEVPALQESLDAVLSSVMEVVHALPDLRIARLFVGLAQRENE